MSDIRDYQSQQKDGQILVGIAIGDAVMDILTTSQDLNNCLIFIDANENGLRDIVFGKFGDFPIRLNLHGNGETSLFIDGPDFDKGRSQSAAIWIKRDQLKTVIKKVLEQQPKIN